MKLIKVLYITGAFLLFSIGNCPGQMKPMPFEALWELAQSQNPDILNAGKAKSNSFITGSKTDLAFVDIG